MREVGQPGILVPRYNVSMRRLRFELDGAMSPPRGLADSNFLSSLDRAWPNLVCPDAPGMLLGSGFGSVLDCSEDVVVVARGRVASDRDAIERGIAEVCDSAAGADGIAACRAGFASDCKPALASRRAAKTDVDGACLSWRAECAGGG